MLIFATDLGIDDCRTQMIRVIMTHSATSGDEYNWITLKWNQPVV